MSTFLIVGASSGIGNALAEMLANEGHRVFGTYSSNRTSSTHANLKYFPLDILDETVQLDFLPQQLDGLAYCPGSIDLKPFTRIKPDSFRRDFDFQVVGAIKVIQAVLPRLKSVGNASVVLFSTVAVQQGFNFHTQVSTSKGAIEGLTRALAAELAPTVRVNAIAPSLTDTPLAAKLLSTQDRIEANALRHPMKRIGRPEDIAEMARFLLSSRASWITGQVIHVDGGKSTLST